MGGADDVHGATFDPERRIKCGTQVAMPYRIQGPENYLVQHYGEHIIGDWYTARTDEQQGEMRDGMVSFMLRGGHVGRGRLVEGCMLQVVASKYVDRSGNV